MGFTKISKKSTFEQQKDELAQVYPKVLEDCVRNARRQFLQADEAKELVNTAARKALVSMENGVCAHHNPEIFMKFIYGRLVINYHKCKKNGISSFVDKDGKEIDIFEYMSSENMDPIKSMLMGQLYGLISEVLSQESPKVQAYWQAYADGFKYKEIAEEHGTVTNTVGSDLHRVKKKILAKFKENGFDQETLNGFNDLASLGQGAQDEK